MRRLILKLLNAVEQGPGPLRIDPLEAQISDLHTEIGRMRGAEGALDVAKYSGKAIDAVVDIYRKQGWYVRRCLAPRDSFAGWADYPHLEFSRKPFSAASQAWNLFTQVIWYSITLPFALFANAVLVGTPLGFLALLACIAIAFLTMVGGWAVSYLLAAVGIDAGSVPFVLACILSICGVGLFAHRNW